MGAVTTVMLFVSVLLHELGQSAVTLRYHIPVNSITLFIFGGVSQIGGESPSASAEFFIAFVGPFISFVLAGVFYGLELVAGASEPLEGLLRYLVFIILALGIFNMIPGYPLDGGRVFRAIVWGITRDLRRSTVIAANVGRFFGFAFIFLGVMQVFAGYLGGIWIALIGWFLESAASSQITQVRLQDVLAGHTVSEAMVSGCSLVADDLTLEDMADRHFLEGGKRCVVVNHGNNPVGLMTVHRLGAVPRDQWAETRADNVMIPLDQMKQTTPQSELMSAIQDMDRDGVNQLPVVQDGRIVGMLSREDVIDYLRRLQGPFAAR
jgi:Zn-dependent protease